MGDFQKTLTFVGGIQNFKVVHLCVARVMERVFRLKFRNVVI